VGQHPRLPICSSRAVQSHARPYDTHPPPTPFLPIDLIDGSDLREMADEVGLDLYNGRIEILRDRTLRPYNPARGPTRR
jgi:restriction endonuclease Mrr